MGQLANGRPRNVRSLWRAGSRGSPPNNLPSYPPTGTPPDPSHPERHAGKTAGLVTGRRVGDWTGEGGGDAGCEGCGEGWGSGGFGGFDLGVPGALAGPPALVVDAQPPVARDRQALEAEPALYPQVAAQLLHRAGLAVYERMDLSTGPRQCADGIDEPGPGCVEALMDPGHLDARRSGQRHPVVG